MSTAHDSIYTCQEEATGDARVYGTFRDQRILGMACDITVERLGDNDRRALDILGQPAFRRGFLAQHISGLDVYGHQSGPGRIHHIGMMSVDFRGASDRPSGPGCREPDPVVIVHRATEDPECHHAEFSDARYFVTLEGIWRHCRERELQGGLFDPFTPADVARWADANRRYSGTYQEPQHTRAIRRLLEEVVGMPNTDVWPKPLPVLARAGRWAYMWGQS